MTVDPKVRNCTRDDMGILAETIRESFKDVALRFGLTPENCPRHPSNCTRDWIDKDMERGVTYFVIEKENAVAGCVALERAKAGTYYLERLAVLPGERRRGLGQILVTHVLSEAVHSGASHVNIGIIEEQKELKRWYERLGFVEGESREFDHLPFRVTFMSCTAG
jgi:N-acetylglutamate synthase-like GNAT family acetyltransferase